MGGGVVKLDFVRSVGALTVSRLEFCVEFGRRTREAGDVFRDLWTAAQASNFDVNRARRPRIEDPLVLDERIVRTERRLFTVTNLFGDSARLPVLPDGLNVDCPYFADVLYRSLEIAVLVRFGSDFFDDVGFGVLRRYGDRTLDAFVVFAR
jgi:hypothetical protein